MNRRKGTATVGRGALAVALSLIALGWGAAAFALYPNPDPLSQVAWLQGCWEARSEKRTIEENWMAPRGGVMIGVGRTVRADTLFEYELVVIRGSAGVLSYEAHPSGQPTATFTAREVTDSIVVFSNPAHDFPQVVGYRRAAADSLIAWIEGTLNGKHRRAEFPYVRVACPGPAWRR